MWPRLVILDLDLTLWDNPDISKTSPPYRRVVKDAIMDSKGVVICLNKRVPRESPQKGSDAGYCQLERA